MADERLTGRPLWYIVGNTDFYGYELSVDERVLIPRPETEGLTRLALSSAEPGDKVLDLCTGSGAIAIALKKESDKKNMKLQVTACDVSEDALEVAKNNAAKCKAEVKFVQSDLFSQPARTVQFNRFQPAVYSDRRDSHAGKRGERPRAASGAGRRKGRSGFLPAESQTKRESIWKRAARFCGKWGSTRPAGRCELFKYCVFDDF